MDEFWRVRVENPEGRAVFAPEPPLRRAANVGAVGVPEPRMVGPDMLLALDVETIGGCREVDGKASRAGVLRQMK